jgi:Nucleotidyl transferase AbiEii toxin, Type IV TA system
MAKSAPPAQVSLERIKQLAVIGMMSDDVLLEHLALKGGNALDLVYQISSRSSVDVDFSMAADFPGGASEFRRRAETSLTKTYADEGLYAFDFKIEERPAMISEDLKSFWGGYSIEFKLIASERHQAIGSDPDSLRRAAINLGKGTKFLIDVSRFEFIEGKVGVDFQGYHIFVYSTAMLLAEKLRAICQQMPEYNSIIKRNRPGASRARDFVDIYLLTTDGEVDMELEENRQLLQGVFAAKRVPIQYLENISDYRDFHGASFEAVRATIKSGRTLQPFAFYFDFVVGLAARLKSFWDE